MLAGCLAALTLCVTAPVMWWKRRGGGALRAPPAGEGGRTLLVLMAVGGILLPLTGLTMLAALAIDLLLQRPSPA
jgi:uncharacterized iron-regulated membrane protein